MKYYETEVVVFFLTLLKSVSQIDVQDVIYAENVLAMYPRIVLQFHRASDFVVYICNIIVEFMCILKIF